MGLLGDNVKVIGQSLSLFAYSKAIRWSDLNSPAKLITHLNLVHEGIFQIIAQAQGALFCHDTHSEIARGKKHFLFEVSGHKSTETIGYQALL